MRQESRKRGFTLIEIVLSIAVLGIVMGSSMVVVQEVLQNKYKNESTMRAVNLVQQEYARVMQMKFSDIQDENGGSRGTPVDFPAPNTNFSYEVVMDPVSGADLDGSAVGSSEYHRIRVKVTNAAIGTVQLTGLMTHTD